MLFKELGFIQSRFDPCVFNKEGVRVVLYVDDLFITHRNNDDVKDLRTTVLKRHGGKFKYPVEESIEFHGMMFKSINQGINITMPDQRFYPRNNANSSISSRTESF